MSYVVYPYLVDLPQLRKVYGSNDMDMVTETERHFTTYIDSFDDAYPDQGVEGAPTLIDALRGIVSGQVRHVEHVEDVELYGYALQLLCMHLGVLLPNNEWDSLTARGLDIVARIDGLKELNYATNPPIPLPQWTDFPGVTYITSQDAVELVQFRPIDEFGSDRDRVWLERAQEQYRSWLHESIRTQKAIVAFLE